MKMSFRILKECTGLTFLLLTFFSCTEKVDIHTVGPPVNVVYGLLNPGEEVQYVRIGRSYNGSSNSFLTNPHRDSITWKEKFSVYIEEWKDNQKIEDVFYFQQDTEIVKDSGFFPSEGLAVYKSYSTPKPLHTYAIYVHFEEDNKISSAWTTIPGSVTVHDPKPIPGRKINLQSGSNFTIRWVPAEKAGVYQTFFKVIYEERTSTDFEFKNISFNSQIFIEYASSQLIEKVISGNRFFEECINQVDSTLEATREVVNVSFEMYIGGEEFGLFLFSQSNGNYLSSGFSEYTNITNGIGIFSSINLYEVSNLQLSNTTLDELAYGDKTSRLGFLDHYGKR